MKTIFSVLILFLFCSVSGCRYRYENKSVDSKVDVSNCTDSSLKRAKVGFGNYVPDSTTAKSIGVAVLLSRFGEEIYNYQPYTCNLVGDSIWKVEGTIYTSKGGAPVVLIHKNDGRIIDLYQEE